MFVSSTVRRVPDHTPEAFNAIIRNQSRSNVAKLAGATPLQIDQRLRELDEEWDIERVLETNASLAILTSLTLGATSDRRWYAFSAVIAGFLLQHAIHGWCPPLPILRRLGFRTSSEIDEERYALKVLRGDFDTQDRPIANESEIHALERYENEGGNSCDEPPVAHREALDQLMEAVRS